MVTLETFEYIEKLLRPKRKCNQKHDTLLTKHQNGVFFLDVVFQNVLEFGEAAQPVITLLRLVSLVPVVNIFVPGVVVWQVVHILS